MMYLFPALLVTVLALATPTRGAGDTLIPINAIDADRYSVSATATRNAGQIQVSADITMSGRPGKAVTLSSPSARPATTLSAPQPTATNAPTTVWAPEVSVSAPRITLFAPRISLFEGTCANVCIGSFQARDEPQSAQAAAATGGGHAAPHPAQEDGIFTGVRIDVISINGSDKVIVVSKVMEQDKVIWAEARTIDIVPGSPGTRPVVPAGVRAH